LTASFHRACGFSLFLSHPDRNPVSAVLMLSMPT